MKWIVRVYYYSVDTRAGLTNRRSNSAARQWLLFFTGRRKTPVLQRRRDCQARVRDRARSCRGAAVYALSTRTSDEMTEHAYAWMILNASMDKYDDPRSFLCESDLHTCSWSLCRLVTTILQTGTHYSYSMYEYVPTYLPIHLFSANKLKEHRASWRFFLTVFHRFKNF